MPPQWTIAGRQLNQPANKLAINDDAAAAATICIYAFFDKYENASLEFFWGAHSCWVNNA